MADLNQLSLEELSKLPSWLVPASRKLELDTFLARKRRESLGDFKKVDQSETLTKPGDRVDDPRGYWTPRKTEAFDQSGGSATQFTNGQPQPRTGPRGGRYTQAKTKDGVPYRRYF